MSDPGLYPSTFALSVFNVLVARKFVPVSLTDALGVLRDLWKADLTSEQLAAGVEFLRERGFVRLDDEGRLVPERRSRLIRTDQNRDLAWA